MKKQIILGGIINIMDSFTTTNIFTSLDVEAQTHNDAELSAILSGDSSPASTPPGSPRNFLTSDPAVVLTPEAEALNEHFPVLGSCPDAPVKPKSKRNKGKGKGKGKVVKVLFQGNLPSKPSPKSPSPSRAPKEMDNSERLTCTKVCHHVKRENDEDEFGCCYREWCTFAHSLAEYRLPECRWGNRCRHGNSCRFFHPNGLDSETKEEYYNRTGVTPPDLPPTSEHTRKPKTKKPKRDYRAPKRQIELTPTKSAAPHATKVETHDGSQSIPTTPRPISPRTSHVIRVPLAILPQVAQLLQEHGINMTIETF